MIEMRSDLARATLTEAMEENLKAFWVLMSRTPLLEMVEEPHWARVITPTIPDPLFNCIVQARLPAHEIDDRIEEALDLYRNRSLPLLWVTGPSTLPRDLGRHLLAHGMVHVEDQTSMALDLAEWNDELPAPAGLQIARVDGDAMMHQWADVLVAGFGGSPAMGDAFVTLESAVGFDPELPRQLYLGYLDGAAVVTGYLVCAAGVAGIYCVATRPEARRRGVGTAITRAALREARERGYRTGVLNSTDMGLNIYRRLGFKPWGERFSLYVWQEAEGH